MKITVNIGETKTGRFGKNAIGGTSWGICINEVYNINFSNYDLKIGDSVKLFNWSNYRSINASHNLLSEAEVGVREDICKKCNIPSRESYQGIEEYIITKTSESSVKIERLEDSE